MWGWLKKVIDIIVLGRQTGLWEKGHGVDPRKPPRLPR
jgi:hypothetical protein